MTLHIYIYIHINIYVYIHIYIYIYIYFSFFRASGRLLLLLRLPKAGLPQTLRASLVNGHAVSTVLCACMHMVQRERERERSRVVV